MIARRTVALLACLSIVAACGGSDPYAMYRQERSEPIPGTFSWSLQPPAGAPRLSPTQAYARLPGAGTEPEVMATLAIVENADDGSRTATAWVFITRHLCYFTAKGDLVSPGRSGDTDPCTEDNLLVQAVDADTGELVRVFSAFDTTHGWTPDRAGDPASAQETGATSFQ